MRYRFGLMLIACPETGELVPTGRDSGMCWTSKPPSMWFVSAEQAGGQTKRGVAVRKPSSPGH